MFHDDSAADVFYAIAGTEVYRALVRERGGLLSAMNGGYPAGGFDRWTSPLAAGVNPSQCCTKVASNFCT